MSVGLSERSLPEPSHQEVSEDAKPHEPGPAFPRLNSNAYRLEMLPITIILLIVLFYWRLFVVRDLKPVNCGFLDHLSQLGVVHSYWRRDARSQGTPRWGSGLYNFFHRLLVWIPIFAVWSILSGAIQWPLLGWAGHITADRSVGCYLRASSEKSRLAAILSLL